MERYLRSATPADCKLIFDWANEKSCRRNSFHSKPIPYAEHEKWYQKVMEEENTYLFILMDFMKPLGQIRVQIMEEKGIISYAVDSRERGLGYGKEMLALVEKELLKMGMENLTLVGETKKENEISGKAFLAQGYQLTESDEVKNCYEKKLDEESKVHNKREKPKREANFEILRILAMMMIIILHYLSKGGLLANLIKTDGKEQFWFWYLEAACLVSVNVYVLISGYFLVNSKFSLSKLISLWCRILFYSIGVTVVLIALGVVDYRQILNFYQLQFFCLPVVNGHYWFATSYLIFYLFAPFLGKAAKAMKQKELKLLILLLLIPFCFVKSILPIALPYDDLGNSFVWFLILFFIAAYIRLYGIPFLRYARRGFFVYLLSVVGIMVTLIAARTLARKTGAYEYAITIPSNYNFIFVLTGSIGLFYVFKNLKIKENFLTKFLVRIAPYTFGVYLLHEHLLIRYAWPEWIYTSNQYGYYRILHILFSTILVFAAGIMVDFLRSLLFLGISKLMIVALRIYYAKREVWDYLIFGALATAVNWVVYIAFAYYFLSPFFTNSDSDCEMISNIIAWIAAVVFAYWTNRTFVFRSTVVGVGAIFREFVTFTSARIVSFVVELVMFYLMVKCLTINDLISKLFISIVVIILNYIFSKLWIFKKNKRRNSKDHEEITGATR